MGPLISAGQRETVALVRLDDGASVAIRGSAPDGAGFWFPPTVLAPLERGARARHRGDLRPGRRRRSRSTTRPRRSRLANDTIYGLSGSVWTRDGARALRVARAIETGVMSINSNTSVRVATPFGGFKQSGVGRELGPHALDALHRGQDHLLRHGGIDGRPAGRQGLRHHGRRGRDRRRDRARCSRSEGAIVVGVDLAEGAPGADLSLAADVTDEDAVIDMYAPHPRGVRPHRRAVQQRGHLAARRRLGARHRRSRRGSACRTST